MTIIGTAAWRTGAALVSMLGAATLAMACDGSEGASGRVADSGTDAAIDAADASTADTPLDGAVPEGYRLIEGGTFTIGSPESGLGRKTDENQVMRTVSSFFLKITEVTQAEWIAAGQQNPASNGACGSRCPVERVTWWAALHFANDRSRAAGLPECHAFTRCSDRRWSAGVKCDDVTLLDGAASPVECAGFRLPTEAEWEYAYRAGTTTAFHNGDITAPDWVDPNLSRIAWYARNSRGTTRQVGTKEQNPWGLFDRSGNVAEWIWDRYEETHRPDGEPNWAGPGSGRSRVLRGGAWNREARMARAAARMSGFPDSNCDYIGFRLARTAPPSSTP